MTHQNLKIKLPFGGDCTRQRELNRSVDDLIRRQESARKKPVASAALKSAGEIVGGIGLLAAMVGDAYLGLAM